MPERDGERIFHKLLPAVRFAGLREELLRVKFV